ncbi:MAG TPA: ABC transporter ATP-binding protein [Patescibacteria group bacterium]|nr:ABC transporter ATP-binding protein [Patescibacteria group bacterium]
MHAIQLSGVKKTYDQPQFIEVVSAIDIAVEEGEFICILGPSGCGKSVLLWMIAGFERPTGGEILFYGEPVRHPSPERIMIFQEYALFPWKTVLENVVAGMASTGLKRREKVDRAMSYIEKMGLANFRDWPPHKLSGGMKQRVAIARALSANPKVLLMDEPFAALDAQHRSMLQRELVRIWQETGKTVIFVTHAINEAVFLADRVYILTARPAGVKECITVNLPRPRSKRDPEFVDVAGRINGLIKAEVQRAFEEEMTTGISVPGKI